MLYLAYAFRLDAALARLGVKRRMVNSQYRSAMLHVGKNSGHSPQEVAVLIASQLPETHRQQVNVRQIYVWVTEKKINPHREEMRDAFAVLAAWDLLTLGRTAYD